MQQCHQQCVWTKVTYIGLEITLSAQRSGQVMRFWKVLHRMHMSEANIVLTGNQQSTVAHCNATYHSRHDE